MILINGQVGTAFKIQQTITGTIMKYYMIIFINLGEFLTVTFLFYLMISYTTFLVCVKALFISKREKFRQKKTGLVVTH